MKKERIDVLLVEKGVFDSRQLAQRSIMAGQIFVNNERVDKCGTKVQTDSFIEVKGGFPKYVSRGGLKLEKAIDTFGIQMEQRVVIDIGASTGGFTDCALQHGARKVYAVDVGYGQLAWRIRQDSRVEVMERTNFRYLSKESLNDSPDFAVIDVSFISLSHIFPVLRTLLAANGEGVALIKPQFEAGKSQVGKKGIIRDKKVHVEVIQKCIQYANSNAFQIKAIASSPILGGEGNIEFLAHFVKQDGLPSFVSPEEIDSLVEKTHVDFQKK